MNNGHAKPMDKKSKLSFILSHIISVATGSLMFAIAINMFLSPSETVIGGATGISTVLNILFGTPIGLMIMLINVPLIITNWILFGFKFVLKTIIGLTASSIATDLLVFLPKLTDDRLLCAILGGLFMGVGLGFFFSKGYTTGGTDLVSCILKRKFPNMSNAVLIFIVDMIIVILSAIILKDFNDVFYSVIAIFMGTISIDYVIGGINSATLALIITDKPDEVSNMILTVMDRGTTLLSAKGGYTKKEKQVVMCVVKKSQIYDLKLNVNLISADSFVIFTNASEVKGSGFETESL